MSADLLRRAAAAMRERAGAANDGPWRTTEASDEFDDYGYGGEVRSLTLGHGGEQDDLIASAVDRSTAEHIASWHPAVALAVADWLDDALDAHLHARSGNYPSYLKALAVAAAYLGEQP